MNYKIISTGSIGNCTIIDERIAIDMGISYKQLKPYANLLKLVLLTHEHSDHLNITTIKQIVENHPLVKFVCCDYLVKHLHNIVPSERIYVIKPHYVYDLRLCRLTAFDLYHDVKNVGYKLIYEDNKIIYATDTNKLDVVAPNYDLYLIEANYDETKAINSIMKKQAKNEFAYEIRAMQNHLSKQQCDQWLSVNNLNNGKVEYMHQHVENGKN